MTSFEYFQFRVDAENANLILEEDGFDYYYNVPRELRAAFLDWAKDTFGGGGDCEKIAPGRYRVVRQR